MSDTDDQKMPEQVRVDSPLAPYYSYLQPKVLRVVADQLEQAYYKAIRAQATEMPVRFDVVNGFAMCIIGHDSGISRMVIFNDGPWLVLQDDVNWLTIWEVVQRDQGGIPQIVLPVFGFEAPQRVSAYTPS